MNCRKDMLYELGENICYDKGRKRRDKVKEVIVNLSCLLIRIINLKY